MLLSWPILCQLVLSWQQFSVFLEFLILINIHIENTYIEYVKEGKPA